MRREAVCDDVRIYSGDIGVPKGWFCVFVNKASDALAVELGKQHADTLEAQAFLTRSLVSIMHNAVENFVGHLLFYVPDRQVGEVVAFAESSALVLPRLQEASAEAYAARSRRQIGGLKFKVLDHSAVLTQFPAGPAALVVTLQRQRCTTSMFWEAEIVIFPPYEGLREGLRILVYSSHLDLVEDLGRWCQTMAHHAEADVGYADGTILATFGADPQESATKSDGAEVQQDPPGPSASSPTPG